MDEKLSILKDKIIFATDGELKEYLLNNPSLNVYIIDILKSRISSKSNEVIILTLMEMLAKNIDSLAVLFADRNFLDYLTDYGKPEEYLSFFEKLKMNNGPLETLKRNKILELLQNWALSFNPKLYPTFHEIYDKLRKDGVKFPEIDPDAIFIPKTNQKPKSSKYTLPAEIEKYYCYEAEPILSQLINNTNKVSDKDTIAIRENCMLLYDLINQSAPGINLENDMMMPIVNSLKGFAMKLSNRLSAPVPERLMVELIAVSDLIQQMLKFYLDIVKGRQKRVRPDLIIAEENKIIERRRQEEQAAKDKIEKEKIEKERVRNEKQEAEKKKKAEELLKSKSKSKKSDTSNSESKVTDSSNDIIKSELKVQSKQISNSNDDLVDDFLGLGLSPNKVVSNNKAEKKVEQISNVLPYIESNNSRNSITKPNIASSTSFFLPPPPSGTQVIKVAPTIPQIVNRKSIDDSEEEDLFAEVAKRDVIKPNNTTSKSKDNWDEFE